MPLDVTSVPRVPVAGLVMGSLPALPELALVGTPTQTLREQSRAADDERRRREKDDARESSYELTAADATVQAERDVAPGSAAFRRAEARAAARQQTLQSPAAFRQELAQVASRPPSGGAPPPSAAPSGVAPASNDAATSSQLSQPARAPTTAPASPGDTAVSEPPGGAAPRGDTKPDAPPLRDLLPIDRIGAKADAASGTPVSAAASATTASAASPVAAPSVGVEPAPTRVAPAGRVEAASGAKSDASLLAAGDRRGPADAGRAAPPRSAPRTNEPTGKDDANVEHIVRLVASRIGKDRSVATLRLDPAELGSIKLHMDLRDHGLNLRVESESPVAHRLLVERVEALRAALQAADIRLERVEFVTTAPPRDPSDAGDGRDPSRPHSDASQPEPERSGTQRESGTEADGGSARRGEAGADIDAASRGADEGVVEAALPSASGSAPHRSAAGWRVNILA